MSVKEKQTFSIMQKTCVLEASFEPHNNEGNLEKRYVCSDGKLSELAFIPLS